MTDQPWPREVATNPIRGTLGSIMVFSAQVGAVMAIEGFVLTKKDSHRSKSAPNLR